LEATEFDDALDEDDEPASQGGDDSGRARWQPGRRRSDGG